MGIDILLGKQPPRRRLSCRFWSRTSRWTSLSFGVLLTTSVNAMTPSEQAKLVPSDGLDGDSFANRIALSADVLVAGSSMADDNAGSAYLYTRAGAMWGGEIKIVGADTGLGLNQDDGDRYGFDIDIDGNTVVVGARDHLHDDNVTDLGCMDLCEGAGYVFFFNDTSWQQQAELTAGDGQVGVAVAVDGDTVVLGGRGADGVGVNDGAAYVFVRSGVTWTEQAKLVADPADSATQVGISVDVSGETIIVGAKRAGQNIAYIYQRTGTTWERQATLDSDADVPTEDDFSGFVAIDAETAVLGTGGPVLFGPGRARVFLRTNEDWNLEDVLEPLDGADSDQFGEHVAIAGNTIVVGARGSLDGGYIFTRDGNAWTQLAKLLGSDADDGDFGSAVGIDGSTLSFGARFLGPGATYVFELVDPTVSAAQQDKLLADNGTSGDLFGSRLAVSEDTAIVGAYNKGDGTAYVFGRDNDAWNQLAELIGEDVGQGLNIDDDDRYGFDVDISGDTVVVGARDHMHDDAIDDLGCGDACEGAVYVFVNNGTAWTQQAELTQGASQIGVAVALDGDTLVAGARDADSATGPGRGAVFVFARSNDVWALEDTLEAPVIDDSNDFGLAVDFDGASIIVGAEQSDTQIAYVFVRGGATGWQFEARLEHGDERLEEAFPNFVGISGNTAVVGTAGTLEFGAGTARVYRRDGGIWTPTGHIVASNATAADGFGEFVAISGDQIVIGADEADAVYLFAPSGNSWSQQAIVVGDDVVAFDGFGQSVAISASTVMVGAPTDAANNGAAYAFKTTADAADLIFANGFEPPPG